MNAAKKSDDRRTGMSQGFQNFGHKRVSTFEKFLFQWKSNTASALPTKKRGPSMHHVASSDWDVFECPGHGGAQYYHNPKTGVTQWECPREVVTALNMGKEEATAPQRVDSEWEKYFDAKHSHPYWINKRTGESSWTEPVVAIAKASSAARIILSIPKTNRTRARLWREGRINFLF